MKNRIHGFNIDMLRICFEANSLTLLNDLAELKIGERFNLIDFYLLRIEGRYVDYAYQIRYYELEQDKLFGELRFGLRNDDKDANIHTSGKRKVWIWVDNRVLYSDEIYYLGPLSSALGLEYHNITTLDLCLDMTRNMSVYLREMMRNKEYGVILNGKRIYDKGEDRDEYHSRMDGSLLRDKYRTLYIKQKKAIHNKSQGICLTAYNKNIEIKKRSGKYYISDLYGNPKKLHRLEVHLNNEELKEYFNRRREELNIDTIYKKNTLYQLFLNSLQRIIRFDRNGKQIKWQSIIDGDIITTPTKGKKKKI